jgi:hypothetical protein
MLWEFLHDAVHHQEIKTVSLLALLYLGALPLLPEISLA